MSGLIIDSPRDVVAVLRDTRLRFKKPPLSVDDFFDHLRRNRLDMMASHLGRYRDLL